ncbi:peptidase M24 [Nostoc sp. HK-01]|nr:peptidase M24 [Nostoc sp. HK-01]
MNEEVSRKLELIRQTLTVTEVEGLRIRGTDWFAWATGGASHTVLLTAETGVAEVLVTGQDAWILTDEIEAQRLKDEELPSNFKLHIHPWADAAARESFVKDATRVLTLRA